MTLANVSLRQFAGNQLRGLCDVAGLADTDPPLWILRELLGTAGDQPLDGPPAWPSHVADDHTPVEFSIAFDEDGTPTLRMLVEAIGENPGLAENNRTSVRVLESLADRFELPLNRFDEVRDLFLPDTPDGLFGLWYSVIFRPYSTPDFKIYFNPEARGRDQAPALVAEALRRLGLDQAHEIVSDHAVRRSGLDRYTFFALDLHTRPQSRVKIYVSHYHCELEVLLRASRGVDGVDPGLVHDFHAGIGGGPSRLDGLPALSSYAFTSAHSAEPSNYSIYLPIRDLVADDESASIQVRRLMTARGLDPTILDDAIAAVTERPLRDGVGLIAYVSLRLEAARQGITVYLSSEAYGVLPPRSRTSPLAAPPLANVK